MRVDEPVGRRSMILKQFALVGGSLLVATGMAAAAIGVAPQTAIDPGLKTLSRSDVRVQPRLASQAVGCVYPKVSPGGRRAVRPPVCAD